VDLGITIEVVTVNLSSSILVIPPSLFVVVWEISFDG